MSALHEPNDHLAGHQALLIGKIARNDVPHAWPDLLQGLATTIQGNDELQRKRGLLILYRCMKALASKRLPGPRRAFGEISTQMFGFIYGLWVGHTDTTLQMAQVSKSLI